MVTRNLERKSCHLGKPHLAVSISCKARVNIHPYDVAVIFIVVEEATVFMFLLKVCISPLHHHQSEQDTLPLTWCHF